VQILKALVLGEEERGQSQYQVMCFATKFNKGDFISSDAMAKLRQKNPHTIRTPEEDKGRETYTMSSWVQLNRSLPITRHLQSLCAEATDATYVRDVDLKAWAELPGELAQLEYIYLIDLNWTCTWMETSQLYSWKWKEVSLQIYPNSYIWVAPLMLQI